MTGGPGDAASELHLPRHGERSRSERHIERIVLTGFMGAGKTTVGRLLASVLGWEFVDTDDLVRITHHASAAQIFATHGEAFFRGAEMHALATALARSSSVIGLGGGLLDTPEALASILGSPRTLLVFLEAPFEILLARCQADTMGPARPLLHLNSEEQRSGLAERYARRLPRYQTAHLIVATEGLTPESVVLRIQAAVATRQQRPGRTHSQDEAI
jgi:shikimate kinase